MQIEIFRDSLTSVLHSFVGLFLFFSLLYFHASCTYSDFYPGVHSCMQRVQSEHVPGANNMLCIHRSRLHMCKHPSVNIYEYLRVYVCVLKYIWMYVEFELYVDICTSKSGIAGIHQPAIGYLVIRVVVFLSLHSTGMGHGVHMKCTKITLHSLPLFLSCSLHPCKSYYVSDSACVDAVYLRCKYYPAAHHTLCVSTVPFPYGNVCYMYLIHACNKCVPIILSLAYVRIYSM